MAKIFISYSHEDKIKVQNIVSKIKSVGHDVWIDESKLLISDAISLEIQKNIQDSDYVIVFLSSNSVGSKWVCQEIYEALYQELKKKKLKLIPCLIDDCELPKAFTKSKKFNRIYNSFIKDEQKAIQQLITTLNEDSRKLFKDENYAILKIPVPNLEIYLAGETYGWGKNNEMKYFETVDSYLLFGFTIEQYNNFKHFVLCEKKDAQDIKDKLKSLGYIVTGSGDIDDETDKRRIWFKVKPKIEFSNHGFIIANDNNQWAERT